MKGRHYVFATTTELPASNQPQRQRQYPISVNGCDLFSDDTQGTRGLLANGATNPAALITRIDH